MATGRWYLQDGAAIDVENLNAISLGDNASITLQSGSSVRGDQFSGGGLFGTGNNVIEFNSNGTLVIEAGAQVVKTGTQSNAETINVHGFGNRIENRGLIEASSSPALWFEDQVTGTKNVVDNYGIVRRDGGGSVIGTSGGAGIQFYNRTGAMVDGDLSFANGDDDLFFYAEFDRHRRHQRRWGHKQPDASGCGRLRRRGASTYSGSTAVTRGGLEAGAANVFSAASSHLVATAGTLSLQDFDQRIGALSNGGRVDHAAGSGPRDPFRGPGRPASAVSGRRRRSRPRGFAGRRRG